MSLTSSLFRFARLSACVALGLIWLVAPAPAGQQVLSSSGASTARISAHLTKTSFKSSQAGSVKLIYKFSKPSKHFSYLLTFEKGSKWQTVKSVKKTGSFKGTKSMTVKKVFAGKSIKVGSYRLKLSADGGSKQLGFKVIAATVLKPANVVINQYGFTAVASEYATTGTAVSWGAVLENKSPDAAATYTTVTANMLDASGRILGTDTGTIRFINPSSHFYLGKYAEPSRSGTVVALELTVQTGRSSYKRVVLPSISNVALQSSEYGGLNVVGELSNTTGAVVSDMTKVSAVVFDASGRIVGGAYNYLSASVPTGARIGFVIDDVSDIPVSSAASVSVSVDPWTP